MACSFPVRVQSLCLRESSIWDTSLRRGFRFHPPREIRAILRNFVDRNNGKTAIIMVIIDP